MLSPSMAGSRTGDQAMRHETPPLRRQRPRRAERKRPGETPACLTK